MAMSTEQIRALDRLRQQLSQLTNSVSSLRHELEIKDPLPAWETLQSSAQALSFNLERLMEVLSSHAQLLKEAHAYPLSNFPGPSQENVLGQLLRKKLEPGVEDWIYENTTKQQQVNGNAKHDKLRDEDLRELWSWASQTSNGVVTSMFEEGGAFDDEYTIAEREAGVENVVTGLKRNLNRDSEDDGEDEDDDVKEDSMEDVMPGVEPSTKEEEGYASLPPVPLESVLRFMTTGATPTNARANR